MEQRSVQHEERQGQAIAFGPFRLLPSQQLLLEGERQVSIGARAFEVLVVLVERAGEVVGKEEIARRVWPDTFVDESNLRVHIAGLRRALRDGKDGNRYIVNVPGRGYSFVAPASASGAVPASGGGRAAAPGRPNALPASPHRIIGRAETLAALRTDLPQSRFITIVGPGGIGKTTAALAVARELAASYRDGVAFVNFSAISGPTLVPSALSAVLGLPVAADDANPAVIAFLRDRQMLLLLDSCEHVIEAAADAAEQIFSDAPGVHILATSLEPLRASGERVHRLAPLGSPAVADSVSAAEALQSPGVQLFVERAASNLGGFTLSDADAPFVAEICRRLDGIALAIELAAGRLAAFGVRELAGRLDDRFRLLTNGRRTALPRHQTLAATLDWSYELLSDPARKLLRHLAVIAGEFTLDTATAMFDRHGGLEVLSELGELVSKSLVSADPSGAFTRYRLLDSTRLYGLEKLRQTGELRNARLLHAAYLRDLFAEAEADCERTPPEQWMATYASQLDNVRAALDWADSDHDSAALLISLTARAVPLWVQLSLMVECRSRVARALAVLETADPTPELDRCRMQLNAALGWALMYSAGRSEEIGAAWSETLALAEKLEDASYRLRALWGKWIGRINKGDWVGGLALSQQLLDATEGSADQFDRMMAERLFATTMHYRGDQKAAQLYLERMLGRYGTIGNQPRVARFQVDQKVTAHYFQARVLWLLGHFDRARRAVDRNVEESLALGHALSLGSVLGQGACPVTLFTGDLAAARRFGAMLLEHAQRYRLDLWHEWACCFEGLVTVREGQLDQGLRLMRAALERAGDRRYLPRYMILEGELAAGIGQAGDAAEGLAKIDGLITRCERSEERWYLPEALRIKGELTLSADGEGAPLLAEALLLQAERLARAQHARAWELRAGLSLARLRRELGREEEARSELGRLVRPFEEGLDTADLQAARYILAE